MHGADLNPYPGRPTPVWPEHMTTNQEKKKINIYFLGAIFQPCLYENNILKFLLHWTLCKFKGALFWFLGAILGAISPWAPMYIFSLLLTRRWHYWCVLMWSHHGRSQLRVVVGELGRREEVHHMTRSLVPQAARRDLLWGRGSQPR